MAPGRSCRDAKPPLSRCCQILAIPALFEPVLYVVMQGVKRMTLAGRTQDFPTGTCAVAAVEGIGANADTPLSVGRLAADVGMSATSLRRHFKAVTGYSPLAAAVWGTR